MKPYNWREAIANGMLAFFACFGAKFPAIAACVVSATACDIATLPSKSEIEHATMTCGIVLIAVEARYVWRYLKQYAVEPQPEKK